MLTLFSPTLGRIDALCRGCRRQKKPADGGKRVVLHGEYVLYQARRGRRSCPCQITDSYYPLRVGLRAAFARHVCAGALQRGGAARAGERAAVSVKLLKSLAYLCYDTVAPRRVTAVFLMGMTSLLGFRPQVGRCAQCGKPIVLMGWRTTITQRISARKRAACSARDCGVGGRVRLTAGEVRYLQAIMRCGLGTLSEDADCPDDLFEALSADGAGAAGRDDSLGEALWGEVWDLPPTPTGT